MAPNPNLTFVLVPGSFVSPVFYDKLVNRLSARGYASHPVPLLSASDRSPKPAATMADDAAYIHDEILKVLDTGKDVVLVMNSYGGMPGTESLKGLSRSERGENTPAVIAAVYIAASMVPEGMSLNSMTAEILGPQQLPPGSDDNDPYMRLPNQAFAPAVFSDMDNPAEYAHYFDAEPCHSRVAFDGNLTHAGYRFVASTYILPDGDQIIPQSLQRAMIERANQGLDEEKKVKVVVFAGAGHCPQISRPDEVLKVVLEAAREEV